MALGSSSRNPSPSDLELIERASNGDVTGMGSLLERHRPVLFADALNILGYRRHDEVEDIVQETFLLALARISQLRNPDAFRWWLRAILRNACYQHLRRKRPALAGLDQIPEHLLAAPVPDPDLHDAVWAALELLPEHLRAAVLLRHFSVSHSYEAIAAVLGIPIGTVRSRLHEARLRLSAAMRAEAERGDGDRLAGPYARLALLRDRMMAFYQCEDRAFFGDIAEDVVVRFWGGDDVIGRHMLEADFQSDIDAGVGLRIDAALGSGSISLIEASLFNPPHDPFHCPPLGSLLLFHRGDTIWRINFYMGEHPTRSQ